MIIAIEGNKLRVLTAGGRSGWFDLVTHEWTFPCYLQRRTHLLPDRAMARCQMRFSPWQINRHWLIVGVGNGDPGEQHL